jgi:protein involved in polysaccharide export with SLBB domain
MLSGAPRFTCRSGVFLLICFTFFISLSVAAAQQASGQDGHPPVPKELPAAQPAAAASASGTASTPQAKADTTKDTADDSMMAKLGPGDLMEVSVYNVPELSTKARVGNSGDLYLPLMITSMLKA